MAELSHPLIVLLVILGAGFFVLMGYAIWRGFHGAIEDDRNPMSDEQMAHMVSVKHRNWQELERAYGRGRGMGGRRIFNSGGGVVGLGANGAGEVSSPGKAGELVVESGVTSREDYY